MRTIPRPIVEFLVQYLAAPGIALCLGLLMPMYGPLAMLRWWAVFDLAFVIFDRVDRSIQVGSRRTNDSRGTADGRAFDSTVSAVAAQLGLPVAPRVVVVDMPVEVAAAAGTSGDAPVILVSRRLASAAASDLAIRAVIAHELGHHTPENRRLQFSVFLLDFWTPIFLLALILTVGNPLLAFGLWVPLRTGSHLLALALRRRVELEADRMAIRAGCGPGLLERIEPWPDRASMSAPPPEWLATHPSTRRRRAQIDAFQNDGSRPS